MGLLVSLTGCANAAQTALHHGPISYDGATVANCAIDPGGDALVLGQIIENKTKNALRLTRVTVDHPRNLKVQEVRVMSSAGGNIGVSSIPVPADLRASWLRRVAATNFSVNPGTHYNLVITVKPIDAKKDSSVPSVSIDYEDSVTQKKYRAKGTVSFKILASRKCF